jgi:hypothetical protein
LVATQKVSQPNNGVGIKVVQGRGTPAYTPTEITFAIATDTQKIYFGTTAGVWTDLVGGAAAAAVSAAAAAASALLTAADRVQTGLDVVATAADVVSTNADVLLTAADALATAADRVQTGLDAADTAADVVSTNADVVTAGASAAAAAGSAAAAALVLSVYSDRILQADVTAVGGAGGSADGTLQVDLYREDGTTRCGEAREIRINVYDTDFGSGGDNHVTFSAATKGSIIDSGTSWCLALTNATGEFDCTITNGSDETRWIAVVGQDGNSDRDKGTTIMGTDRTAATWSA